MFFGSATKESEPIAATDDELAAAAYGDPAYWTAQAGNQAAEPPRVAGLDNRVVDSIMRAEGPNGEQGGRLEVYGFRQGNGAAYDNIMAARARYGQGSAEERAVVSRYLTAAARSAGALNFTDPGKQAAIMSMAHMRGVGGAQAIVNAMTTGGFSRSGQLSRSTITQVESMSPDDFQLRLRDARVEYDQQVYGATTTTVRGQQHNWWDYYGQGLQDRYDAEADQFRQLSNRRP